MIKTGSVRIKGSKKKGPGRFCASCRRLAKRMVTFEDSYSKLTVPLCDTCAEKKYDELLLQGKFDWPE